MNIIKNWFRLSLCLVVLVLFAWSNPCYSETMNDDNLVLKTGVSLVETLPDSFIGTWRVVAKLDSATNYTIFKSESVDVWNLIRNGNVLVLENPFSGARAEVQVSYVSQNRVNFVKIGNYDTKRLTDKVELRLNEDRFIGINNLKLETLSNVNGEVLKTDTARYLIKGEKISGMSIFEK